MEQISTFILAFFCVIGSLFATHNRAGEITYEKVEENDPNDFRYKITITTCTNDNDASDDRDYLYIKYGDEALNALPDSIERVLQTPSGESVINIYTAIHTYPGAGTYILSMEDPNRNGGVVNMDNSDSQRFYLESMLTISPIFGHNNSVVLLYPAKDEACVNQVWEHNPAAYDVDGDSLVYSLIPCRGLDGLEIASWELPNEIAASPGTGDLFSINSQTGTITWDTPILAGEFNIAIKIEEYRNGFLIGYVIRDMQINVQNCGNTPPILTQVRDTCIIAHDNFQLAITATDENSTVDLEAIGAPMTEVTNLATFTPTTEDPSEGVFQWIPGCQEIRPATYQVIFRAEDNAQNQQDLVDLMEMNITVIAPPVENVTVEPNQLSMDVSWDAEECDEVIGYKVYRRTGFFDYQPDHCETGVPESTGYVLIATLEPNIASYNDSDGIDFGEETCYIITACYLSGSESISSEPTCNEIDLIIPVITKVSVGITDLIAGVDTIHWAPPFTADTSLLTPPFRYKLYHGEWFSFSQDLILETETSPFISSLPREFIHEGINTESTANAYRVELIDADENVLTSRVSSSTFLTLTPDDNELTLEWQSNTSWGNSPFEVYRLNAITSEYELIATTNNSFYVDTGLTNNSDYCYYIKAFGAFFTPVPVLPNPTLNFSQEVCTFPVDLTAPCAPELQVDINCEDAEVELVWNNPNNSCADDVTGYRIYFKPFIDSEYALVQDISNPEDTSFTYINEGNITGCFQVTAIDSLLPGIDGIERQNESISSLEFCSESCSFYEIPNVFSPQGDNFNDLFRPFPYQYVDSIDLTIFNRWGTPVFETTDADINWNGLNMDSGEISSDGVYFYTMKVFTSKLTGVHEETLTGNITLLDGQKQPTE